MRVDLESQKNYDDDEQEEIVDESVDENVAKNNYGTRIQKENVSL